MLVLRRLEMRGFGPFADTQALEFPDLPGVTVIYGENMRGKTTLLNAIRYAFFGTVLGRGARARRLHTLSNRENAAHGEYGFQVSLTFDYDGDEFELVRSCTPREDEPANDSGYNQSSLLRREDVVLGPQERERALEQIFPSEIARFFLFDGELLQEYEELLINESEAGHRISEAIERILGVPILKRGRAHLVHLSEGADKQAAREALKHSDTQVVGAALEQATVRREAHQNEILRLQDRLSDLISQRAELELYLQANQKYTTLLREREGAEGKVRDAAAHEKRLRAELQQVMADAWRSLLRPTVRAARQSAHEDARAQIDHLVAGLRFKAIETGHCDACDQEVPEDVRRRLSRTLPERHEGSANSDDLSKVMARVSELERFVDTDNSPDVKRIWREINAQIVEQVTHGDRITDLSAALSDANPTILRDSNESFSEIIDKIGVVRRGIEEERERVSALDQNIQRLKKQLEKAGGTELRESQRRAHILRDASDVLGRAVENYKSELRSRVESTASKLFLAMTTERTDYAGLTINEGYGLSIRHTDGRAEEARSAGAEHVVALALMGALQHHAPLRGPIVMDSPFGRLDEAHTRNVVKALPQMANQVVLLAYESEIGRDHVRDLLGTSLLREYELRRVSARRTVIGEVG